MGAEQERAQTRRQTTSGSSEIPKHLQLLQRLTRPGARTATQAEIAEALGIDLRAGPVKKARK